MTGPAPSSLTQIRGSILRPHADSTRFDFMSDAIMTLDHMGVIASLELAVTECDIPETMPGCVWMPGFVDTHIHFPQTRVIGSASGPLLQWLETSIFPEEARFKTRAYAQSVATEFCSLLAAQGTTSAAIYSSSDPAATDILFHTMAHRGLRGLVGLTLMDRHAPEALLVEASEALESARCLIERWHGFDDGRLGFCVTPRFAVSCSPTLLRDAGRLAQEYGLAIQTHLSENLSEIEMVRRLFPKHQDYLDVYDDFGLLGARSLLAHCIHLSDANWDTLAGRGCAVSHCPDSNFFLGSGQMPLNAVLSRQIPWGLGTDVGAGRTFSLRRVVASAYDTAMMTGAEVDAETLLWQATTGGAKALGYGDRVGRLEPGFEADMVAIPLDSQVPRDDRIFDALVFRHDVGPVAATYVRGRLIHQM
jgi:guanine deaminase